MNSKWVLELNVRAKAIKCFNDVFHTNVIICVKYPEEVKVQEVN